MLREARFCLLGRTGLKRFVAAERFLVRYYEIVFPEFQNFTTPDPLACTDLDSIATHLAGKLLPSTSGGVLTSFRHSCTVVIALRPG